MLSMTEKRQRITKENIPILITSFNRPDLLSKVLGATKSSGCLNIYFATDGPRNLDDKNKINECIDILLSFFPAIQPKQILRHEVNLGCRIAMGTNIEWFFKQVELGIVLEDDCLPSSQFFDYMINALEHFQSDSEVFLVSGYSPIAWHNSGLIRKSVYPLVWGWGSWADRIEKYEQNFKDYRKVVSQGNEISLGKAWGFFGKIKWRLIMKLAGDGTFNTWDYSLTATAWRNRMYSIHSSRNYIENLGFREDATHTYKDAPIWAKRTLEAKSIESSLMPRLGYGEREANLDFDVSRQIFTTTLRGWLRLKLSLIKKDYFSRKNLK